MDVVYHIEWVKAVIHINLPINAQKGFHKGQHPFLIKPKKMGVEGTHLNTIKAIYNKLTVSIILNKKQFKAFPLKFRMKQFCPLSPFFFSIVLGY